ncbi:alpha/beta fold hydrolase [Tropicimonas marinistellae]|uniref:alpha/beta fold hydrolase n=1 Tax=Tropicimonas marinistellae TaxID=1739787 RepID=UPI0008368227|nr:alpha/beta hydrolase [Tropicimonas marinistellae]
MSGSLPLRRFGQGSEPVLALHCMLGHGGAWAGVAAALDESVRLVAPDLPGHGAAAPWQGGNVMQAAFEACSALFNAPMHLVGHSFGAVLALRLACAQPHLVRTLTMIDPVFFAALRGHPLWASQREEVARLDRFLDADDREGAARYFSGTWGTGRAWEDVRPEQRQDMISRIHIVPDQWPALYDDDAGLLRPGVLEALDLPVLIAEGTESPPAIAAIVAALARRLPDARSVPIAGARHMLPLTHPAEVAAQIRAQLARG